MNNTSHRMEEECPFKNDGCEIEPCTDYTIVDGEFIKGEPMEGRYWCKGSACPLSGASFGPSAKQLWAAYMDKKIRFAVDMYGNPTTTIVTTAQTVRSEKFTKDLYNYAIEAVVPYRDKTGLRIDREWWKKKRS